MRYFGGKTRICKDIAKFLTSIRKNEQTFLSPFIGGGWVECLMAGPKICSDKHIYLIEMYKALRNGWIPPKTLTKEEYYHVKNNPDEKPYLTGFVGFGCSFAGKWFGGYAKESNTNRNFCLNAHNSIMKKMKGLQDTLFICTDYKKFRPIDFLIYCDPPYAGTTQYSEKIVGQFDSEEFWEVMRGWSTNNTVIISEYNAPEDFKCVWQKETKLDIRDRNNQKRNTVEKLFQKD